MTRLKVFCSIAVLAVVVFSAQAQTATVTNLFPGVNKAVPDGDVTGVSDTQIVSLPDFYAISNLEVLITISNGFNGDLYGYLVKDTGFTVLLNRVGRTSGNSHGNSDTGFDVLLSATGFDIHNYQTGSPLFSGNGQLTGTWAQDGRITDPSAVLDTDSQTALLTSFNGLDPSGSWTLFLADLDFGEQSTLLNWGLVITAAPEPSAWAVLLVGAMTFGVGALRRRLHK